MSFWKLIYTFFVTCVIFPYENRLWRSEFLKTNTMKKSSLKNPDLCKKNFFKNVSLKSFYLMTAEYRDWPISWSGYFHCVGKNSIALWWPETLHKRTKGIVMCPRIYCLIEHYCQWSLMTGDRWKPVAIKKTSEEIKFYYWKEPCGNKH